jgi:RNA polymerase sigma factor (sigma-70 family)
MARSPQLELERLYRRYHGEISTALARELGDRHEAEDATQEAFLNAYRALARGNRPAHARSWLHAIALNAHRRRHRKRRPREVPLEAVADLPAVQPEVGASELVEALAKLPADQRSALLLREIAGHSYADVAERLGRSEGSVQMLLFRARQNLRAALGSRGSFVVVFWQRIAQRFAPGGEAPLAGGGARAGAAVAAAVAVAAGTAGSGAVRASLSPDRSADPPARAASIPAAPSASTRQPVVRSRASAARAVTRRRAVSERQARRRAGSPAASPSARAPASGAKVGATAGSVAGRDADTATGVDGVTSPQPERTSAEAPLVPGVPSPPPVSPLPQAPALPAVPPVPDPPPVPTVPPVPDLPPVPDVPPVADLPPVPPPPTVTVPALPG